MTDSPKCSYCDQPLDRRHSSEGQRVFGSYGGKENRIPRSAEAGPKLHILRNAPTLLSNRPCPRCQELIEHNAVICVHCGFNLETGRKTKPARRARTPNVGIRRIGWILLLLAMVGAYQLIPREEVAWVKSVGTALASAWQSPDPPVTEVESNEGVVPEPAVAPAIVEPETPQEEDRAAEYEARKRKAEEELRRKLDERFPLHGPGDAVELRLQSGRILRGRLVGYRHIGSRRIAVISAEQGHLNVAVNDVDRNTRIRLDPEYRDHYIRHHLQ